jgi:DNA repair exonuclease SbcCD ATPase subunit
MNKTELGHFLAQLYADTSGHQVDRDRRWLAAQEAEFQQKRERAAKEQERREREAASVPAAVDWSAEIDRRVRAAARSIAHEVAAALHEERSASRADLADVAETVVAIAGMMAETDGRSADVITLPARRASH